MRIAEKFRPQVPSSSQTISSHPLARIRRVLTTKGKRIQNFPLDTIEDVLNSSELENSFHIEIPDPTPIQLTFQVYNALITLKLLNEAHSATIIEVIAETAGLIKTEDAM